MNGVKHETVIDLLRWRAINCEAQMPSVSRVDASNRMSNQSTESLLISRLEPKDYYPQLSHYERKCQLLHLNASAL
jgi:hypothetical protein